VIDAAAADSARASLTRAVAVSTSTQLLARGFDLLVNITVSLAILRHLGPSRYGDFILVVSVVGLAGLLSEFGLPKLAVRDVARDESIANEVVGTVIVLRLALCAGSVAVTQVALLALDAGTSVRLAALVAGAQFVGEALLSVTVVFHVALRQHYEAFARLAANVVKLGVVIALVAADAGLVPLVGATTAQVLAAAFVAWVVARRRFGLRPRWDAARARPLLRAALPVGPAMLVGVLYLKLDALMVGLLGSRHDVGVYGAAYQPIEYLFLASAIVVQVMFPLLARARDDAAAFTRVYRRGAEFVLASVLPVSVMLAACAVPLVRVAFRDEYRDAATPLVLLACALVLMALNVWQGLALLAAGRQAANLGYLAAAVALNVALDVVLVPWLGPVGAAWGTLVSAAFLVACSTIAAARLAGVTVSTRGVVRVLAANAMSAAVLVALRGAGLPWAAAAAGGALAYVPALARCGVFGRADLRALRRGGGRRGLLVAEHAS
jgi:O-antigen/teichoic acid export membrane protein